MTSQPDKQTAKARLVTPENTLKKKVGNGGFDEAVLTKAQSALDNNTVDFRPIATELLNLLKDEIKKINAGEVPLDSGIDLILYPMMQLKAQGSLFHYPTITNITFVVVDFLENTRTLDKDSMDIVEAYIKSAQAMLMMQLKDPNHKVVKQLVTELELAGQRYKKLKT